MSGSHTEKCNDVEFMVKREKICNERRLLIEARWVLFARIWPLFKRPAYRVTTNKLAAPNFTSTTITLLGGTATNNVLSEWWFWLDFEYIILSYYCPSRVPSTCYQPNSRHEELTPWLGKKLHYLPIRVLNRPY
jgi:hypothetical protein